MFFNVFNCCWFMILSFVDFEFGFFVRSCHIVFVSMIFVFIFLHFCKVFLFFLMFDFSFSVWFCGFAIYFLLIILTFLGYVLPCTQMSYWGLTVFSNLFTAVPVLGACLILWFWGSDFIQDFTLVKCHIIHIALPFVLLGFVFIHLFILHYYMSSDGFLDRFCFYLERIIFCTFIMLRDIFLILVAFFIFIFFVFLGWFCVFHEESFILCNIVKTSDKIIPEWFFLFFFGFIKSVPDKFFGLCFLIFFIFCFVFLIMFYFEYFGRCMFIFLFNFFVFGFLFLFTSLLAVIVLLVYPCYLELQFCLLLLFLVFILRF